MARSDIKTGSLKPYAWTITLILILASFVFITLITNSKSNVVQNNIRVLKAGNNNYRRIDTCISILYVAENNSRLFLITADSVYLDKYTQQMQTVSSILTEFQEEKKRQTLFSNLYLPQLLQKKQIKNKEFISLKKTVDSLLVFRVPARGAEQVLEEEMPYTVKKVTRIAKVDSVQVAPKKEKKRLWKRLVDAVSNKPSDNSEKTASVKSVTTIEDSLAWVRRKAQYANLNDSRKLDLARNRLNRAELDLLAINNHIFSNLQTALKALKAEEVNDIESLRMSLLLQASDKMTELDRLSWANIALVLILTFMIIRNIVKLYKSENTIIRYSNQAVESAKKKGEFLSHVSHEIRTPLNSIIGFSRQIDEDQLSEGLRIKINAIRNSSDVLLMLVNEILDFSKFESGKIKLLSRPFYPQEMLDNVVEMLSVMAGNKNITVLTRFALDPKLMLNGDDFRLKQVVINLLTNAVKFTPAGGRIVISASFEKAERGTDGMFKMAVQDSGVGIEEKNLKRIFEDFTQIETPDDASRELGTGLGLAISKKIVDLYQGRIDVESALGKGSLFSVEVPLDIVKEGTVVTSRTGNTPAIGCILRDKKILMVDDVRMNLLLLSRIMDKNGIQYDLAYDGEEAYKLFQSADYDLIITDVQMPKMNGLELTGLVRSDKDPRKSKIPVIGYTGSVSDDDRSKYLDNGMNDLLDKPFTENDLIEVLSRVVF